MLLFFLFFPPAVSCKVFCPLWFMVQWIFIPENSISNSFKLPLNLSVYVRSELSWGFSVFLRPSDLITLLLFFFLQWKPHQSNQTKSRQLVDEKWISWIIPAKFHIYFWVPCTWSRLALALEWHIFGKSHHYPVQSSNRQCVSSISLEVAVNSKHIPALPCFIRACWWSRCLHRLLNNKVHACHCFVVIVVFLHLLRPYNQKILCRLCCFKGRVGPAPPTGNEVSW